MILSPLPVQKFFDNNGEPLVGGLLFTYEAGTSTPIATYTDASGVTPNTNPIVLDFRGEARVWLDQDSAYKFILSPSNDTDPPTNPIWTVDNITVPLGAGDITQQFLGQIIYPKSAAETTASANVIYYIYPYGDVKRYGGIGNGIVDDSSAVQDVFNLSGTYVGHFDTNKTYLCNSDLTFPGENSLEIEGNGALLSMHGTGSGVSFTLVGGTIYPTNCSFRNLFFDIYGGTSRVGIVCRTSASIWENVVVTLKNTATTAVGWSLPGDEVSGTGPYYNSFISCGTILLLAGQRGVVYGSAAPLFRAPNANNWYGGRFSSAVGGTMFTVTGSGNGFYGQIMDGAVTTGFSFVGTTPTNCTANNVFGGYLESVTNAYVFDASAGANTVYSGFLTGVTNVWTDANGTNTRIGGGYPEIAPQGITFPALSAVANVLDYYGEGTFTPVATFATPGDVAVTYGASNRGSYTRIGNMVFYRIDLQVTNMSFTTAAGAFKITGLPFAAAATADTFGASFGETDSHITYSAGRTWLIAYIPSGLQFVSIGQAGTAAAMVDATPANFTTANPLRLLITGSYPV